MSNPLEIQNLIISNNHQCKSKKKESCKKVCSNKPLISIITVVYNGEKYLEETIQSVINQTYDNIEYIIIDGGSTDGTLDIINKYKDKIDYWVSEKDSGIYDAMNKGIDLATGEWINFMNAGDYFFDYSTITNIRQHFNYPYSLLSGKALIYYYDTFIQEYGNEKISPHQASFFRTTDLKENKFDLEFKIFADSELLNRLKNKQNYISKFIDTPICKFFLGGIGNHPKYFYARLKEEMKLKKKYKQAITLSWLSYTLIITFGYLYWKLFGEKKYYLVFVKSLLAIINSKQKNNITHKLESIREPL